MEAESTLQDLAPRTSVRSDAFDVGKQDMSVSIALRMEKVRVFFSVQRRMASARSFNMFPSMLHMRLIN